MKFKSTQKAFEPFDFTITIENIDDAELLFHLFNMSRTSIENMHGIKLTEKQHNTHIEMFNAYHELFDLNKHKKQIDMIDATEVLPDSSPGKRLRGLRFRDGYSQTQVAQYLGIKNSCPVRISEYELDKRKIDNTIAKKLGKLFNVADTIFIK